MIKTKLLSLLLIAVLLLSACTPSNLDGTENTTPSTSQTQTAQPTEPPIPTVDEVINCTYTTEGGLDGFSNFYYVFKQTWDKEDSDSISITRTNTDGTETVIELSGKEGKDFKYKVGDTTLTFPYLVYCRHPGTKEDNFEYLEYFLMANDPNATYLDTLEENGATAVIVYAEYLNRTVSRAESYGDVPEGVQAFATIAAVNVPYSKNSIFYEDSDDGTLKRYDYNGNLISCLDPLPEDQKYMDAREMPDGGFVVIIKTYTSPTKNTFYESILCYDKDANLRWEYTPIFENEGYDLHYADEFYVHKDSIYVFATSGGSFIRLSLDGKLISKKQFNMANGFRIIIPMENGFEVHLNAHNNYNDFPISENGETKVKAILDLDGNIVSISYEENRTYREEAGILADKYIFTNDPIFEISDKDKLPADPLGTNNVFGIDGGYVLVRKHILDECHMWRGSGITQNYYYEIILTGYDSDGNPLWQTTSPIIAPVSSSYTTTNG